MTREFSSESRKWLNNYHGSIDATALLLAFDAGAASLSTPRTDTPMDAEQLQAAHRERIAACPEHVWRHGGHITDADECIRCGGRYLHTISEGCRDTRTVREVSHR